MNDWAQQNEEDQAGDYPLIQEADFYPAPDVFRIWVSRKERNGTKNGEAVRITYWEGVWDIPRVALAEGDTRKRPQITASSSVGPEDAEEKCRQKVLDFWMRRTDTIRQATYERQPVRMSKEERAAGYTVRSFLEEWFASKSNPNTAPQNRWAPNTARNNKTMLEKGTAEGLGDS